jgi:hypothetical protein
VNDDRFEELLRETAKEYNRPPETPKAKMWAEIERQRGTVSTPGSGDSSWWRRAMIVVPVAAAAVLVLGIGIGRWTAPEETIESGPITAPLDAPGGILDKDSFFRAVANRHLEQTETLLTLFALEGPGSDGSDRQQRVDRWARELLGDTRLLMDSPAAEDPALQQLLTDLEFFLARIVHLSGERPTQEKSRINDDIRDRGVLMRLRSQLPAGHV